MLHVKCFVFSPIQENTYVLFNDSGEAMIIDPGCYFPHEQKQLRDFLSDKKLTPIMLLNTHCHLDHVFGNKWVHNTYGLELHIHPLEEKVLAFAPQSGQAWGMPFENYSGPLHFIKEGEELMLGDENLDILWAPGHSPGSICFYHSQQKILLGGDVLFRESIGRTDLPGGNHTTLLNSIREQLFTLPDDVVVYSGHGIPTKIGYEKEHNPFLN